jgi:hypothetical protein
LFYARLRSGTNKARNTNDVVSDPSWVWSTTPGAKWETAGYSATNWQNAVVLGEINMQPWRVSRDYIRTKLATYYPGRTRAALVAADPLTTALGRPNREQVVTTRPPEATTLQALELTNGETLADICKRGADNVLADKSLPKSKLVSVLFAKALGREPRRDEARLAGDLLGTNAGSEGVQDLLWSLTMLPEFQLIY